MEIGNIVRINRGSNKGIETVVLEVNEGSIVTMVGGPYKPGALTFVATNESEYVEMGTMTNAEIVAPVMIAEEQVPTICGCGCGLVAGKDARFVPGHDQKLRSRLLIEFDHGSIAQSLNAAERLVDLGWYSLEELAERKGRNAEAASGKATKLANRIDKVERKIEALREELHELEEKLAVEKFHASNRG